MDKEVLLGFRINLELNRRILAAIDRCKNDGMRSIKLSDVGRAAVLMWLAAGREKQKEYIVKARAGDAATVHQPALTAVDAAEDLAAAEAQVQDVRNTRQKKARRRTG